MIISYSPFLMFCSLVTLKHGLPFMILYNYEHIYSMEKIVQLFIEFNDYTNLQLFYFGPFVIINQCHYFQWFVNWLNYSIQVILIDLN